MIGIENCGRRRMFLGNNAGELLAGTGVFPISQDQRNTLRTRLRVQVHPRVWFAFAASYNSGLPFEVEGISNQQFIEQQYGARILSKVNFERGRIHPSASLDLSAGIDLCDDKFQGPASADASTWRTGSPDQFCGSIFRNRCGCFPQLRRAIKDGILAADYANYADGRIKDSLMRPSA